MFNLMTGLALLTASVIAGGLWGAIGPKGTFLADAAFTALAVIGQLTLRRSKKRGAHLIVFRPYAVFRIASA
jgi:hypothetical protein